MIKFVVYPTEKNKVHGIGLGLEDGNLDRLMRNQPIFLPSSELKCPEVQTDFLIMGIPNPQKQLEKRLKPFEPYIVPPAGSSRMHEGKVQESDNTGKIPVLRVADLYYVVPLTLKAGGQLHIIVLDDRSIGHLKRKQGLTYRTRIWEGSEPSETVPPKLAFEILLFWGPTAAQMEMEFATFGLIGPETRWERYPYGLSEDQQGQRAMWGWRHGRQEATGGEQLGSGPGGGGDPGQPVDPPG